MENKNIKHGNESSVRVDVKTLFFRLIQNDCSALHRSSMGIRCRAKEEIRIKQFRHFLPFCRWTLKIPQRRKKNSFFPFCRVAPFCTEKVFKRKNVEWKKDKIDKFLGFFARKFYWRSTRRKFLMLWNCWKKNFKVRWFKVFLTVFIILNFQRVFLFFFWDFW